MEYSQLLDQNPWWEDKNQIEKDFHIQEFNEKKIFWDPKLIKKISLKPFSFNIILGPRQVGKTTALKLMIKELLRIHKAKEIFYFNCDGIANFKDLIDLVDYYLSIRKEEDIKNSIIILDEIMSPENWTKAIKFLIDKGSLKKDILIATGSNSIRVKREAEYFPGRRGYGKDILILPLNFRRFIEVLDPDLFDKLEYTRSLDRGDLVKAIAITINYTERLNRHLRNYFKFGGFPLSLNSMDEEKNLFYAKKVYRDGFISDLLKVGLDISTAKETISAILDKMPSHFSYNNIGLDIGKSSKTIETYLKVFKDIYSITMLHNIDLSSKKPKYGKNKKIHFLDPFLVRIFKEWTLNNIELREPLLAESAVVSHISCLDFGNFSIGENIGYWSNSNEIDAVVNKKKLIGIEVKWSEKMNISKYSKYKSHFKDIFFLGKNEYSPHKSIFPLACFLAVLDEKTRI